MLRSCAAAEAEHGVVLQAAAVHGAAAAGVHTAAAANVHAAVAGPVAEAIAKAVSQAVAHVAGAKPVADAISGVAVARAAVPSTARRLRRAVAELLRSSASVRRPTAAAAVRERHSQPASSSRRISQHFQRAFTTDVGRGVSQRERVVLPPFLFLLSSLSSPLLSLSLALIT